MKYLLVSSGCAECLSGDDLLIQAALFDTFEEAKDASWLCAREWKEHPQGGWYSRSGQGDDWIFEVPVRLDPKRIEALKRGELQWGHEGEHNGVGSEDCPRELHHHHDFRCKLPTPMELFMAGVKKPEEGWHSRR